MLSGGGNASDRFWALEKRIREDKKDCGVQCRMSRSNLLSIMISLLNEGAITFDDLEGFSDDLKIRWGIWQETDDNCSAQPPL